MRPRFARSLLLLAALPFFAAGCREKAPQPAIPIERATFAPALGVDLAASTKTPSGLYWRDITVGTGAPIASGQQVAVHYVGTFADGKQFDANGPDDEPFVFRVGAGEVIDGWDEGVAGMRVGGQRQLVIPPELGYGAGNHGPIPGNSILVFTVTPVRVQ